MKKDNKHPKRGKRKEKQTTTRKTNNPGQKQTTNTKIKTGKPQISITPYGNGNA